MTTTGASAAAAAAPGHGTWILANIRPALPLGSEAVDLVIAGGEIAASLPAGTAKTAHPGAHVEDGRGMLALPGLINAHAHVDKSWWG